MGHPSICVGETAKARALWLICTFDPTLRKIAKDGAPVHLWLVRRRRGKSEIRGSFAALRMTVLIFDALRMTRFDFLGLAVGGEFVFEDVG
jgi:hypothetical protein